MENKIKSICCLTAVVILFLSVLTLPLAAGTGEILFVETDVDLQANGSAVVAYTVQWRVLSGEFHGFYFQGNDRLRVERFSSDSYAVDSEGNKYNLDINAMGGDKWDIILANGKGVPNGTVTYVFYFSTNFAAAGYLAPTTSAEGKKLAVFNWSPVLWDEAANSDHYTLKILTPFTLPQDSQPRSFVDENQLILTEKWVNEKFLIDYQRGPKDRLLLVFHKNNPGNRFNMRTQFYMPVEWFELGAVAEIPAAKLQGGDWATETPGSQSPPAPTDRSALLPVMGILGL
ncbi:MAG: hypothetical protein QG657_1757, partial [Acidobacteriota bacterium]|nr:hypothetical protein [Acidobacteriota bacterium]